MYLRGFFLGHFEQDQIYQYLSLGIDVYQSSGHLLELQDQWIYFRSKHFTFLSFLNIFKGKEISTMIAVLQTDLLRKANEYYNNNNNFF